MRRGLTFLPGNPDEPRAATTTSPGARPPQPLACLRHPLLALCLLILTASSAWAQAPVPVHGPNPNFGTYPIGEVGIQLVATGGTGTYTWQVIGGTLPPGVSLRNDSNAWPSWVASNTSGMLFGIATTPGLYNFTLRVTSGGISVDQNATIRISNLTVGNVWDLPRGYLGKPYSQQLIPLNATGPVTWTFGNAGTRPPGITLSSGGIIGGTPTQTGYYSFDVLMTSGGETIFRWINLEIHAVEITSPAWAPNATVGVPYSATITGSGGTAPYTFSASFLPNGLTLNSETGVISGTPTSGRNVTNFTITMTDANNVSTWKDMSIAVLLAPQPPPRLSPFSNFLDDCTLGWVCERGVSAFSGGTAPFTWAITGQPPGMDIAFRDYLNANEILIGGTPTALGTFNVTVTVTDAAGLSTTNVFPIRVSPLLQRFDSFKRVDLVDGLLDQPYSSTVAVIGGVLPYTAAIVGGQLPPGLTFNPTTFVASGTPTAAGSFFVDFEFTDAIGQTLRVRDFLTIDGSEKTSSNGGTIFHNFFHVLGTATNRSNFSRTLTACCAPSYVWTAMDPLPPGLSLSTSGVLSGIPTVNGDYRFRIRVADGMFPAANWAEQRYFLTVATAAPIIAIQNGSLPFGNVGSPYNVTMTSSGGTGTLTWTLAPNNFLPPGLTLATNGTLSGTPTATGQFAFSINVTDGALNGSRFFTLFIYPPGSNGPLDVSFGPNLGTFNFGQLLFGFSATGGTPPYQYSLTPGANPVPGMRVQTGQPLPQGFTTTGGLIGVVDTAGVFSSSLRVTDSLGATLDRPFTFTVVDLQILSQTTLPRALIGTPYSFALEPYGGSGGYGWTAFNLPAGMTINSSGQLQGTPTASGNFFPTFTLTDLATGASRGFGFTLAVDAFSITNNGELPDATFGVPYSQTFSAPGCQNCTWSASANFPTGLSFSNGVLSGTPSATTSGRSITVTASGTNGTVQKTFSIKVLANSIQLLLNVTNTSLQTTVGGGTATGLFATGGTPPYTWTFESGSLPPGIKLDGPGETLGSTLLPGFTYLAGRAMVPGLYNFTLRLTDSIGNTTTQAFTWNVTRLLQSYTSLPLTANTLSHGVPYNQPLLGLGGTSNYTWTNVGPMPLGLALDPTGVVSGQPGVTGSISVPIQLTDDAGNTNTTNVTFNIVSPTGTTLNFAAGPNLGTIIAGSTYTQDLGLNGGAAPYTVTAITALPPGLTLLSGSSLTSGGSNSWVLGGTPLTSGSFTFTLRVVDSLGNVGARTFTLAVSPLTITTSTLANAGVTVTYMQPLLAAGGNGAITWSLLPTSALPPGLAISPGGVISGIPTQVGIYSFTVVATDATGNSITRGFSITVAGLAITDAPILPTGTFSIPYGYTFSAVGGNGPLVWSATTGLPPGLTLSPTGTLSGTPTVITGLFAFTVSVTDGVTTFSKRFSASFVPVVPTPFSLVTTPVTLGDLVVGQATSLTLPNPSGGVGPFTWTVAGGSLPPGMALVDGARVVPSFNPGQTILAGAPTTAGTYTFDLAATDSKGVQSVRTFTLNVSTISIVSGFRVPTVGVAYSQQFTTVGGTLPYTYSIGPNSATVPMLPPGLTFTSAGLLSGTTTSTGLYQARLRVIDGAGRSFTRILSFTIANPSNLVVLTNSVGDMSIGTGRSQTLNVSSFNAATVNATWSHVSGTLPPGVTLLPNTPSAGSTSLGGRPTALGTYTFTLRATDQSNTNNFADREFTVRVVPMQIVSPPVEYIAVDLPGAQIGQPYSTTIRLAGGTPPYTFAPSPLLPLPAGLSLSPAGVLSGTPQQAGLYAIGFDASDAAGHTATSQQVALTITPFGVPRPLMAGATGLGQASVGVENSNNLRGILDSAVRGGVRPYTWSLHAGSSLPPGLRLIPGGNGVSDVLGGVPTTAGTYQFSMDVTDAVGQSVTLPLTLTVVVPSIGPQTIPNGTVGAPYSATLAPSGGAPPYSSIQLLPVSDLPPGLTLSAGGVLSGTPTHAGNFFVVATTTDANGGRVVRGYRVTINNAAGEAQPATISPNPIQVSYVQGSAVVPTVMNVGGAPGIPFTAVISGIPGASLSSVSSTTPATIALNLNLTSLSQGTYTGIVGIDAPTAANLYEVVPVSVTVLPPAPCSYTVNPTAGSMPSGFTGGSFSVSTGPNCAWTAVKSDSWITIVSAPSSSGPGTVSYFVTANPSPNQRTGSITVNGAVHSITQFGTSCSFAINPSVINAPASGGSAVIAVSASSPSCNWTASGLGATPASGTGSGSTTVTIPPNGAPGLVVLNATIGGQPLTVNQVGVGCTVTLDSSSTTMIAAGGQGAVLVTAPVGCSYSTVTGPNWISVTSGGSGNGTGNPAPLIFNVAANSTTLARSGSLTIGGQTFQIDQDGLACSVTVDTSGLGSPYGPAGGVGLVGITTNGPNCSWSASSAAAFATVSPLSGTGNGNVSVTLSSNAGSISSRSTNLTIGGQLLPIQQSGTACTYNLQSLDGTVPASGGSGTVGVVAPAVCTWNAASNTPPWLSVLSPTGAGSSNVQFVAQANPNAAPRVGTLTVAGLTYTVTQAAAPCSYTLGASNLTVASTGASSSFAFSTAATGCAPAAVSYSNWITGVTTSFNGTAGSVSFTIDPTPYTTNRVGTIQLGDRTFTVTQTGGTCGYSLSSYGALFGKLGGTGSVIGSPTALGCTPATGTTQPTIITLDPLVGPVNNLFTQDYTVAPFDALNSIVRKGQITFGGVIFTVKQSSY